MTEREQPEIHVIAIPANVTDLMKILSTAVNVTDDSPLTAEKVEALLDECLLDTIDGQKTTKMIIVAGILNTYAFDADRIEAHVPAIKEMLDQLPDTFRQALPEDPDAGGGWSFLNLCMRKDGVQWTGLHWVQEMLMCLGAAAGWVYITDKRLWDLFYGGMPYVTVRHEREPHALATDEEVAQVHHDMAEHMKTHEHEGEHEHE